MEWDHKRWVNLCFKKSKCAKSQSQTFPFSKTYTIWLLNFFKNLNSSIVNDWMFLHDE